MFDAKIERTGGILSVTLTSEPLETVMKSLAGDKSVAVSWLDGTISGPGVEGKYETYMRWEVKASKLQASLTGLRTGMGSELFTENGIMVNLIPLTLKGLGRGVTIKPSTPYPVDQLKAWAEQLRQVTKALLTSVQPVLINVQLRPRAASGGEE